MPGQAQWWAVVNGAGELVSSGSVVADPLPGGLMAVETTEPLPGQLWDADEQAWYTPDPPPTPPAPADVLAELATVAANAALSTEQKLTQVFAILASAAVPQE